MQFIMKICNLQRRFVCTSYIFVNILIDISSINWEYNKSTAMELKQKYLYEALDEGKTFEAARAEAFERIMQLITIHPNDWMLLSINCNRLISLYKSVFGLTSEQLSLILSLFTNVAVSRAGICSEARQSMLSTLNLLLSFRIAPIPSFRVSNQDLFLFIKNCAEKGIRGSLAKDEDCFGNLCEYVKVVSRFGCDVLQQALELAIEQKELQYVIIFVNSSRNYELLGKILQQMFEEYSVWERDHLWYFLLAMLAKRRELDITMYYQQIFKEVINVVEIVCYSQNQEEIMKYISTCQNIGETKSILHCIVRILVRLLCRGNKLSDEIIWSCVERTFSLVTRSLARTNQFSDVDGHFQFLQLFLITFLHRYNTQKGYNNITNPDFVDKILTPSPQPLITIEDQQKFDALWVDIIPKLLYFSDPNLKPSRILIKLLSYKPRKFIQIIMKQQQKFLVSEDSANIGLNSVDHTMKALQKIIFTETPQFIPRYFNCCLLLLSLADKIKINNIYERVQLVLRLFVFADEQTVKSQECQSVINRLIRTQFCNLQTISLVFQQNNADDVKIQSTIIDLDNFFISFFVRLTYQQLQQLQNSILLQINQKTPQNHKLYEQICSGLSYVDPNFTSKIMKLVIPQLIISQKGFSPKHMQFIGEIKYALQTRNKLHIQFYCSILNSVFRFHPKNIILYWGQLQAIIDMFLIEQEYEFYNQSFVFFTTIISTLCKDHLQISNLTNANNFNYKTFTLKSNPIQQEAKSLLLHIFDKYYLKSCKFIYQNNKKFVSSSSFLTIQIKTCNGPSIYLSQDYIKLFEGIFDCKQTSNNLTSERKTMIKVLPLQYFILDTISLRLPFYEGDQRKGVFPQWKNIRKQACIYIKWVIDLLAKQNIIDSIYLNLLASFWEVAHAPSSNKTQTLLMQQKLYTFQTNSCTSRTLKNAFLITAQALLLYYNNLQLIASLNPVSYLNDANFLQINFFLKPSPSNNSVPILPIDVDVHCYHRQLVALIKTELDPNRLNSPLSKYIRQPQSAQAGRHFAAFKTLLLLLREEIHPCESICCMQDQFVQETLLELVSLHQILPKSRDKKLLTEFFKNILIFDFQNAFVPLQFISNDNENIKEPQSKYCWGVWSGVEVFQPWQPSKICQISVQIKQSIFDKKRNKPQDFVSKILHIIQTTKLGKEAFIYLIMLNIYCNFIPLNNPIHAKALKHCFELGIKKKDKIFSIAKGFIFRLINRIYKLFQKTQKIKNEPIQRNIADFFKYKFIRHPQLQNLQKFSFDNGMNPPKYLICKTYSKLQSDPSRSTYQVQTMISVILQQYFVEFLKVATNDLQLKRNQKDNSSQTEVSMKGIQQRVGVLYYLFWDSEKISPFTITFQDLMKHNSDFYGRLCRRIFTITNQHQQILKASEILRQDNSDRIAVQLGISIGCEGLNIQGAHRTTFLCYLSACSKENFDLFLKYISSAFEVSPIRATIVYNLIQKHLKNSRLRRILVLDIFCQTQGYFARDAAMQCVKELIQNEGALDQIAVDELGGVFSSIVVYTICLSIKYSHFSSWCNDPLQKLTNVIGFINKKTLYRYQHQMQKLFQIIAARAKQQDSATQRYNRLTNAILGNIMINHFHQGIYRYFQPLVTFLFQHAPQECQLNIDFSRSDYPDSTYQKVINCLSQLNDISLSALRQKLRYLQRIVTIRSFSFNNPTLIDVFLQTKSISIDHVSAYAYMLSIFTKRELQCKVQELLNDTKDNNKVYKLMAVLKAAGVRQFQWRQLVLKEIIAHKKNKVVKEFVSLWWKQLLLEPDQGAKFATLVKRVQNPYSYFA